LCLLPKERLGIKIKINKALNSTTKNWSDSYRIKRKDGSFAYTVSRASIIRNDMGEATHLIGATQDVSRLQSLEIQLKSQHSRKKQSDLFELAAKLSYDGIWDWNILTNEFFLGAGFEELFGYAYNDKTNT